MGFFLELRHLYRDPFLAYCTPPCILSIVVDTPRTAESDRSTCSKLIGHDCALWRTQARVRVVVSDYTVRKRVLSRLLTFSSTDTAGLTRTNMQLHITEPE